jgi:hypothetical protein
MKFLDDYQKREWLGRRALLELQKLYSKTFKYEINFTPGRYDDYDAYFTIFDENGSFKKAIWIEIKTRYKTYPDYYLEKEKWDRIEDYRKRNYIDKKDVLYFYLCFCPEGTYIWNITNMENVKWTKEYMNKSTSKSRKEKENKPVVCLKIEDSKSFNYTLNEFKIIKDYEDSKKKQEIKEEKITNAEKNSKLF